MSGPVKLGQLNDAGNDVTTLRSNAGATLFVEAVQGNATVAIGVDHGVLALAKNRAMAGIVPGDSGLGVAGSAGSIGVAGLGHADQSVGVYGATSGLNGYGLAGQANNGSGSVGVWGKSSQGWAGFFSGDVRVFGNLFKSGGGFKIDHPLDPENKFLSHSFVESPAALNIYQGNIVTDLDGNATVTLPDYFESLNEDYCYQLTSIGQLAHVMVAQEIRDNQFKIKTDRPAVKVSWQVTGVRRDPFAATYPIHVEDDKPTEQRGTYLHPEAYGKPESQGVNYQQEVALAEARTDLLEREVRLPQEPPDEHS